MLKEFEGNRRLNSHSLIRCRMSRLFLPYLGIPMSVLHPSSELPETALAKELGVDDPAPQDTVILAGGGEMGERMRAYPWETTSLGPMADWPQSLLTAVRIILNSRYAMFVWWGTERINLYNDPYRAFLGAKHPAALGKPAQEAWAEIWSQVGPRSDAVLLRSESTYDQALLLLMERHGYLEETYFTFSYSPLPDDQGKTAGIFCAVTEETERVVGERRLNLLRELAGEMADARTPIQACRAAAAPLAKARQDLPFSLLYLLDADGKVLSRVAEAGIDPSHPAALPAVALDDPAASPWPFARVIESGEPVLLQDLSRRFPDLPRGAWDRPPDSAILLPIAQQGQKRPAGVFVAGLNPHRAFGEQFRGFVSVLSNQIAGAVANANAYEAERKRAEDLAELDRAKTRFFSNVSHEFRTPLTLMLGPLEEALADGDEPPGGTRHEQIAIARRNALRLLKLVNTLLDFSRIEAGRMRASYAATDLATLTADIASVFRSVMEKAGLTYVVDCPPLAQPVYVDREMWEKIVLNLLSNAFKFTLAGTVSLSLRTVGSAVELSVEDTGSGIPEDELPRVFERFHRIENSSARTHEGTGIGLALVRELARMHGGSVRVESRYGSGCRFTVRLPLGPDHLPSEQIRTQPEEAAQAGGLYLEEIERWTPAEDDALPHLSHPAAAAPSLQPVTVLVADDNADMLTYLNHLLSPVYNVLSARDGRQAIAAVQEHRPALVLTDVMMPKADGFGVLRAIRENPALSATPVILLSARAGEEAQVEGLDAGADDYLVKPFTARELMARVGTHIRMAQVRRHAAETEAQLRAASELERGRLREVLALAPAAMGLLSGPEHRWSFVNDSYIRVTGRESAADFVGKTLRESLPELEGQPYLDLMDSVYRTGRPYRGCESLVRLNRGPAGEPLDTYFDFIFQPMRNSEDAVEGILVHAVNVTEQVFVRKRLEASHDQLKAAHLASQRLAAIVESSDDAIVSKDLNGIVASWNAAAEKIFGFAAEEMIGEPILRVIPDDLHYEEDEILRKVKSGESTEHYETKRRKKTGEIIDVSVTISPIKDESGAVIGASKIARDISDRKRVERLILQSEKLAATGRMAAAIAHEINNPLESLMNVIYLARQYSAGESKVHNLLVTAEGELERVAHIARQTLGYYRDTGAPHEVHLHDLLENVLTVYRSKMLAFGIAVDTHFNDLQKISASKGEMLQVFSNVIANAIDAMTKGGTLNVSTRNVLRSASDGIQVTVRDNGTGIAQENMESIFEPFFTTKGDLGTGIGLWVAKQLVERRGGQINLTSSTSPKNAGTTVTIFIPFGNPLAPVASPGGSPA